MAARRCSDCGINYPFQVMHCPVHGSTTDWFANENPDEDWEPRFRALKAQLDANPDPGAIPAVAAKVRYDAELGAYFMASADVINSGVRHRLQPDDLIQAGEQVYEVQGYRDSSREYWVRPFTTKATDEALARWLAD